MTQSRSALFIASGSVLQAEDVEGLALHVLRAHVDHAFQAELGADGGGGHAVLPGPGFGDDASLTHAAGQDDLAQHVVDLMRAGVVQLVPLEIDLCSVQLPDQTFGAIQRVSLPL